MADYSSSRKPLRFEILIERYFSNFLRIILTNLLFFIPFAGATALFFLAQRFLQGGALLLVLVLLIVSVFPFYAGVVLVSRNIARGDKDIRVFSGFLRGIKENYLRFIVLGALFSVVAVFSYYSIALYSNMLSSSWIFYVMLFVCIIIALAVVFMFFYAPVMSVTFDLSLKSVLKNSFLMSFGEIKNNFCSLFSLAIVLAIALTIVAFCTNVAVLLVVTVLLVALILPASCQTVTCFFVYDDMFSSISNSDSKLQKINDAIDDKEKQRAMRNMNVSLEEDYSDVDISTLKDTDEYIFYNGKMIKQSVLLKKVLEQRGQASDKENKED